MSRSGAQQRDWFFIGLATLSFVADFYTVYQIMANAVIFDFWTWRWIISLILIALLTVGGLWFLAVGGSEDSAKTVLFLFGVLYTLCSLVIYLYWAFNATERKISPGDFFGFLTLFAILVGVGIFGIFIEGDRTALRFPSYGYATASLVYVVLLVNKYVGEGASFAFWSFAGQVIILLIGIALFISLFVQSENSGTQNS